MSTPKKDPFAGKFSVLSKSLAWMIDSLPKDLSIQHPPPTYIVRMLARVWYREDVNEWFVSEVAKFIGEVWREKGKLNTSEINAGASERFAINLAQALSRAWHRGDHKVFSDIAELCRRNKTEHIPPGNWENAAVAYARKVLLTDVKKVAVNKDGEQVEILPPYNFGKTATDVLDAAKADLPEGTRDKDPFSEDTARDALAWVKQNLGFPGKGKTGRPKGKKTKLAKKVEAAWKGVERPKK